MKGSLCCWLGCRSSCDHDRLKLKVQKYIDGGSAEENICWGHNYVSPIHVQQSHPLSLLYGHVQTVRDRIISVSVGICLVLACRSLRLLLRESSQLAEERGLNVATG